MGRTLEEVEAEVKAFNEFYDAAPPETKAHYSQRSGIEYYEHCFRCGGSYMMFRPSKPEDCPRGCTLQPILIGGE